MPAIAKKIILLVIISALLAGAGFFLFKKLNQKKAEPVLGVQPFWAINQGLSASEANQPADEENYRQSIKQIVVSLTAEPDNQALIKDSYEKILALTVPPQYRQLHLSLVLALAHLGKAEQFEQGRAELAEVLSAESWLGIK